MKYTDIMIDVESLGNEGNFLVTELALVPFNLDNGKIGTKDESLHLKLNIKNSLKHGFKLNLPTIEWWLTENPNLLCEQINTNKSLNLYDFCDTIKKYIDNFIDIKRFWATATLDYQAISNLFDKVDCETPFKYNKRLCARTIRNACMIKFPDYTYNNVNTHNPYEDCSEQITKLLNEIKLLNIL